MRSIYFWAAIAWTLFVTVLCLVSIEKLGGVNDVELPNKDKYGHFVFYFIFTLLWYAYLNFRSTVSAKHARLISISLAFIYGTFVEISQGLFTQGREADVMDIVFNTLGSITAAIGMWLIQKSKK
ncbi:VanZ family protein [Flavobacterium salilacus subsp. salilacus]|uniref:VanZ family protein n=1 Tax=Flavobacterium TaxID=237 RepID=UPI0013C2BF9D|nr:VanZ family protein [Flavobacterium salilacus]KAF2520003.1 VanZ family protein [Flavobacterium salilacus subsp. salilacus]MBE1614082.1 VanZ family protein [Flavobacterium sp. SaA2.13]